jgi:hypothetical protein
VDGAVDTGFAGIRSKLMAVLRIDHDSAIETVDSKQTAEIIDPTCLMER